MNSWVFDPYQPVTAKESYPDVAMMETVELWPERDLAAAAGSSPERGVLAWSETCPPHVVITRMVAKRTTQMAFAKHDHMIEQSRQIELMSLAAWSFCHGEQAAVERSRMPIDLGRFWSGLTIC